MRAKLGQKTSVFLAIMTILILVLVARLYYLQIIHGEAYLQRSESNFIQERVIKHSRGKILDSDGRALADNRLAYDVYVTFALLPDSLKSMRAITHPLGLTRKDLQELDKKLLVKASNNDHSALLIKSGVLKNVCRKIAEIARTQMIGGVNIIASPDDKNCDVSIDPRFFPSNMQTYFELAALLKIEKKNLSDVWDKAHKKAQGLGRFKPNLLISDIGFDAYARIENAISLGSLAGITVVSSQRRRYIYGDLATHVIGFLNQVSLSDIQERQAFYRSGDVIGRTGVEGSFEDVLRGNDGVMRVVVDAKGRRFDEAWEEALLGSERIVPPRAGESLKLSINAELQAEVQKLFKGVSGSIIVSEVNTGFVLAMASFPSFDPNSLVSADNSKFYQSLLNDKAKPLRNKAIQDHYSPGSTFKPITAIAGLSKKLITPNYLHSCSGNYQIHRTVWRCFERDGHGPIALKDALKRSCDSYFYELGQRMGLDALAEVAQQLGFGVKTDIGLLGETAGILPTREYYKKRIGYVAPGFVVNMSIGQGDMSASPIQVAMAYGAVANGGTVYQPQLVKEILNDDGEVDKRFTPIVKASVADAAYNFDEIMNGLSYVTDPQGSASSIRYNPENRDIATWLDKEMVTVVGKTGTAQVVKLSKNVKHLFNIEEVPYEQRDHAWFVAVYPKEAPKIVIVVMVEHGGFAGRVAAPIALRVMKTWAEMNKAPATFEGG